MSASDSPENRLARLEAEEREVSTMRRKLHDRLANFQNESALEQERELSDRRRHLHAQIDELRAQLRAQQGRLDQR